MHGTVRGCTDGVTYKRLHFRIFTTYGSLNGLTDFDFKSYRRQ